MTNSGMEATIVLVDRAQKRVIWRMEGGNYRVVQYPNVDDFHWDDMPKAYNEAGGRLVQEFEFGSTQPPVSPPVPAPDSRH